MIIELLVQYNARPKRHAMRSMNYSRAEVAACRRSANMAIVTHSTRIRTTSQQLIPVSSTSDFISELMDQPKSIENRKTYTFSYITCIISTL